MTGNKFAGELCAYCCERASTSDDHVFARKFFLEARRRNLLQVPACGMCNGAKAALESELMNVLGFGGRHADGEENLGELVAHRLANKANARIVRNLQAGTARLWVSENGVTRQGLSVPIGWNKVLLLFCYVARGLAWHHFGKLQLGNKVSVVAGDMIGSDGRVVRALLSGNAAKRVDEDVGAGTFHYRGAQGIDNPSITVWQFSIYGGVRTEGSGGEANNVGVLTGPSENFARAEQTRDLLERWRNGTRLHG